MKDAYMRRVLYTAMRPHLDDASLVAALEIWQTNYVNKPSYTYTQFLSECCKSKTLKRKRPLLLSAILAALELPESQLLVDPYNVEAKQFEYLLSQTTSNDARDVFVRFVEAMLVHLQDDLVLKVKAYLIKHVRAKLKLNSHQMLVLKTWMTHEEGELGDEFDDTHKRSIINLVYMALCEYVGPVQADQLLALAVKEVTPLANQCDVNLHDYL